MAFSQRLEKNQRSHSTSLLPDIRQASDCISNQIKDQNNYDKAYERVNEYTDQRLQILDKYNQYLFKQQLSSNDHFKYIKSNHLRGRGKIQSMLNFNSGLGGQNEQVLLPKSNNQSMMNNTNSSWLIFPKDYQPDKTISVYNPSNSSNINNNYYNENNENFISFQTLQKTQSQFFPKRIQKEMLIASNLQIKPSASQTNIKTNCSEKVGSPGKINQHKNQQTNNLMEKLKINLSHNKIQTELFNSTLSTFRENTFNKMFQQIQLRNKKIQQIQQNVKIITKTENIIGIKQVQSTNQETLEEYDNQQQQQHRNKQQQNSNNLAAGTLGAPQTLTQALVIKGLCMKVQGLQWMPQSRQGSSISFINNLAYLIGGRISDCIDDVAIYQCNILKWVSLNLLEKEQQTADDPILSRAIKKKLLKDVSPTPINHNSQQHGSKQHLNSLIQQYQAKQMHDNELMQPFNGRCSHTACVKGNKIFVFGGERNYNVKLRKRECFNDIWIFHVDKLSWQRVLTKGEIIEGRRYHSAAIVGQHMVVIGGTTSHDKMLGDIYALDLIEHRWINCCFNQELRHKNIFNDVGIACHSCCPIYEDETAQNLFSSTTQSQQNKHQSSPHQKAAHNQVYGQSPSDKISIKEEGLYVYGGINNNDQISDKLYVLKTGNLPLTWKQITTAGKGPGKRYKHSMNFVRAFNILVIFGGLDDSQNQPVYFNEAMALNLKNFDWINIEISGSKLERCAYHCTCVNKSQIIVFGGINNEGYISGHARLIELDPNRAKIIQKQQELTFNQFIQFRESVEHIPADNIPKQNIEKRDSNMQVKSFLPMPKTLVEKFFEQAKKKIQLKRVSDDKSLQDSSQELQSQQQQIQQEQQD